MIPKFDTYYTNLHSSFLIFDKFLDSLKKEYFNGFILIESNNKKAYLFMFEGESKSCLCTTDTGYKKINPVELTSLLVKNSFVSACWCVHEKVDFFSQAHTAKQVYSLPAKNSIDPEKLIAKCCQEKFTGYLETGSIIDREKIYIYFDEGNILGSMNVNKKDYYFETTPDKTSIQNKLLNIDIKLYKLSPDVRDKEKDLRSLLNCYGKIFKLLETQGKNRDFSSVWRKCALELSDKFIFLDPFAGEFTYKHGKIDLWEEVNINTAIRGIDELVHLIAGRTAIADNVIMTVKNRYLNLLAAYEIK
ncbi:MAG: hypothetical protein ABFR31_01770 [Thermodesulfobacteriota bacterium]